MPTVIKKKMINGVASFLQYWRGNPVVDYNPGGSPVPPTPVTGPFYLTNDDTVPVTVSVTKSDENAPTISLEVSDDGNTWTTLGDTSTTALDITIPVGGRKYLRSTSYNYWDGTGRWGGWEHSNRFSSTGRFGAHGSITELLGYDELMGDDCESMFEGCTGLTTAPSLPSTTLNSWCYMRMFKGCTSLTTAPDLLAITASSNAYRSMFEGCTSLVNAPTIAATSVGDESFRGMFKGCTSLVVAPSINVTTFDGSVSLAEMFEGCTSLTTPPAILPATTLGANCYDSMFKNCISLTYSPELPATIITGYGSMFYGCSSLSKITCNGTNTGTYWDIAHWVEGVASFGIFYKNPSMNDWSIGDDGIPAGWDVVDNDLFYLTNDDTTPITVSIRKANNEFAPTISLETSDDGATWTTLGDTSTTALNITIPVGGKKYLRSISGNAWGNVANGNTFSSTGRFGAHGNIMKLLGYDALKGRDCEFMFENCSNLTTAPELPATTLAEKSYRYMFSGCTLLNEIKCNATDISATDCTEEWLDGVASSGTFYKNANMSSWTTGISGIPSNWTTQNISQ